MLWIFYDFRWFFHNFIMTLILFIDSTADFFFYFAFFSMRKQAINLIFPDLEFSEEGATFWFFLFLDHFPFLVTGKSIFKQGKWAADSLSARFEYFGQFRNFEGVWEFFKSSSRPCQLFALFFKLSYLPDGAGKWHWATSQQMPAGVSVFLSKLGLGKLPKPLGSFRWGYKMQVS